MPLYDHECRGGCGKIFEDIRSVEEREIVCPYCGGVAVRVFGAGDVYTGNQDAAWIRTVLEVVDKDSDKPHVKEFLTCPNRATYMAWMKGEGLRPLENNEKPKRLSEEEIQDRRVKGLLALDRKRNRIEVREICR